MLATKRRAVSMMNSTVKLVLHRNQGYTIKIGKFSMREKATTSKNMEEMKMDP